MSAPLLETARRLVAYIPRTLARQIAQEGLPPPGRPRYLNAATLFSDISGFTRMAEELASDGPRGAEELNRVLLLTFTAMIDVIHEAGGAVSHFHGDAMSVYFPDEDGRAAERALACAWMMQRLMVTSLNRAVTSRPAPKDPVFYLTMRIGVGYGRCLEMVVGDPADCLEFVLAGPAVDEAAAAQQQAEVGEVIASQSALSRAGLPAETAFSPITGAPLPPTGRGLLDLDSLETAALERLVAATVPFLPPALSQRLQSAAPQFVAEHRPVTTLFVQFDGINYEADNAGNLLQLYYQWASEVVKRYGGENSHLNRLLTGDKGNQLHIIFGAPVAPDSPDQAIRCALALQREKPAYITGQKIGLAAGKVFACPVGSESRREYTVVGDVVNLSARLSQVCAAGGVLVSELTAARTGNMIDFDALPPVQLKGKQEPASIYRVSGERRNVAQLQPQRERQRPLIGREQELDLLLGGLELALHGVGGAAALYGPIGVGKTRLLAAGVDYWLEAGGVIWVGVCQPHTADVPFGPWLDIWRDFFGLQAGMTVEEQVKEVVDTCLQLWPEAGDDVGLWGEVLGLPIPLAPRLEQLAADVRRARFFNLVRHCFQAAVATRPALIVLEDVHWADHPSLELVDDLSELLSGLPLFLAITYRPAVNDLSLAILNRPICTPIVMSDLPPQQARALVHHLVGESELPLAVEQHLGLRDQEGRSSPVNPLFLEEALRVMLETGVLSVNGRVRVNEELLTHMQVPDTIHGLLLARLDHLPAASRDVLQVASVIGRQFGLDTLGGITPDRSRNLLVELLSDLSDAEMTQLIAYDPELTYLFQHAMTREVAYESLSYARRQTLHEAIADWLVERYADNLKPLYPVLAYHYGRTDIHEKGLQFALAAAHDARDIFANKEAIELYRLAEIHLKAMGEARWWETAVEIYLARGEVFRLLGDLTSGATDAEEALTICLSHSDWAKAAESYNLLASIRFRQARFDEACQLVEKIVLELADKVQPAELARAYMWQGMLASRLSDYEKAITSLKMAEEICIATENYQRLAGVLEALAFNYYSRQELKLALPVMQRAASLFRKFGKPDSIYSMLNNIALIQFSLGEPEKALESFNEAVHFAQETSRNFLAIARSNRGEVLAYLGDYENALNDFKEAVAILTDMADPYSLIGAHLLWGYELCTSLGDWTEAKRHFEEARGLIALQPENYPEEQTRLLIGVAHLELRSGSIKEAQKLLQEAEALIEAKDLAWWRSPVYYMMGLVGVALQDTFAATYFQKALDASEKRGCPDYKPLALLELAKMESDADQRLDYLRQCLQAAEKRARYIDKITCYRSVGQVFLRSDDLKVRQLGQDYLDQAERLENSFERTFPRKA